MIVLGVNDNHDASAALVAAGELVAAVGQERIARIKNSSLFPWDAMDEVLRIGGVRPGDVDQVVFGSHFTPSTALRRFPHTHQSVKKRGGQFSPMLNAYVLYQVALRASGTWEAEAASSRRLLTRRLGRYGYRAPVTTVDHHLGHAASAYLSQTRDPSLVLTVDAMGDGTSVTVGAARGGRIELLYRQSGLAAINTYYSRITEFLGFRPLRHEGKVTGLAAYVEPPPALLDHFRDELHFTGVGFNLKNYARWPNKDDRFHRFLRDYSREEIASACQRNLEIQLCRFVRTWVRRSGIRDLAVAGGLFANVKLNQRIHELDEVDSLFVYPNMGDGGLAAGSALLVAGASPGRLRDVYLGSGYGEGDCERALRREGLAFERPDDLAGQVADLLVDGKVVARFDGRMEWGPRALGNRTLLYRPDDPSVNDWLNERLGRTEFMPFAPVTQWEHADRCYRQLKGARDAARFMTVCFDCTDWMRRVGSGVVHVDGTARPQLLRREDNPAYHDILEAYRRRTGNPSLINTSFNMHEEPIVRSPEDAVRGFLAGRIDHLILGPFLVRHPHAR